MNYKNYIPHIHTEERPEGFPVRRVPGRRNWVPVGLGEMTDAERKQYIKDARGDTPLEVRITRGVSGPDGGGAAFSSVPVTPLLLAVAVAVFLWSQKY